ncbi:PREDICTED: late cornified envelope protein 3D-like [Chrysochloris asiatica]|uniref:Late cornified envelope protein 3D-like n=1 Tax=Chrysochloris asiatica TaxID=185453 RepID=A0A9B0WNR9_CHRAS|nr:PREDICTED: late cornified envelope protein 3D-like [Chrysochloris asiatica]
MSCQQNQQQCQAPPKCPLPKCPLPKCPSPKCPPKNPAQCLPPVSSGCTPCSGGCHGPSSEAGCFLSHHRRRRSHGCRRRSSSCSDDGSGLQSGASGCGHSSGGCC